MPKPAGHAPDGAAGQHGTDSPEALAERVALCLIRLRRDGGGVVYTVRRTPDITDRDAEISTTTRDLDVVVGLVRELAGTLGDGGGGSLRKRSGPGRGGMYRPADGPTPEGGEHR